MSIEKSLILAEVAMDVLWSVVLINMTSEAATIILLFKVLGVSQQSMCILDNIHRLLFLDTPELNISIIRPR